jgi:pantoate--beta-alanine ligase
MKVLRSLGVMQRMAMGWRRAGCRVGFVPTMGFLHEGHVSLMDEARRQVGADGLVVVSIYVNPTQFGPGEDLSRYPRDFKRDQQLCREAGVDVIFYPSDETMYPGRATGGYSTYVEEERLGKGMEGSTRPTHFRGVTTVVAKLFHLVLPDVAVFGAKDWQQAAVIRRMVRDLNFPLKLVVAPTRRESDGLAMSSRNTYLDPVERRQATVLFRAMGRVRDRVRRSADGVEAEELRELVRGLVKAEPMARLDYVEFFEPDGLEMVKRVVRGSQMALAVYAGKTRLIDNGRL